ncbi:3-hydroxyacyl-CoA dehydrogenase PaaC [Marinomonas sp. A79]|uniref:3-hydroxyacyl-CoA dehydrogenase PaaC n=1 Tax=Marinomonas vulgaris TaxID=2823372 RepID=A0ABS5HDE8_9GAMM|nr:3-hydroxyacyl-CoA dehydrogenase PaaH [Marinomonas vulgaris]MBR7889517.1 3-hydroxyacyl-CoA dehydrogenase PaaC [Marinomonas vulgaris]
MTSLTNSINIGVIGAGAMGAGIAQVAAQSGHQVTLYDNREGAAQEAIEKIAKQLSRLVERQKMTADAVDRTLAHLHPANTLDDFADAGLVIEAIVENIDVKQAVFSSLETICSADCILASNTSSISITRLAAGMAHPERFVGMHFFNPAPIMKLVEVVSGLMTAGHVAETVYHTAHQWGKKPVYAASTPGFIVNRVARPFYAESLRLKQEGVADCATLDALIRGAGGFRMGAFELTDLIGHDVNYAVTCSVFDAYYGDFRFQPSLIQKELVEAGMLGRKSGQGFYSYGEDATLPAVQYCPVSDSQIDPASLASDCVVSGDLGVLAPLTDRLSASLGQALSVSSTKSKVGVLRIGDANLVLTDGRMACERAQAEQLDNLILVDLALNYDTTTHLALSRAFGVSDHVFQQAVDGFALMGVQVSEVTDSPGLVVMRTVAMLANEAADAALNGVASVSDIDTAMTFGVNYPIGPLAWGDRLGVSSILTTLNHLQQAYGEDRYRASLLIKKLATEGRGFHE